MNGNLGLDLNLKKNSNNKSNALRGSDGKLGVFWVGNNGRYYTKDNRGKVSSFPAGNSAFVKNNFRQIDNPSNNQKNKTTSTGNGTVSLTGAGGGGGYGYYGGYGGASGSNYSPLDTAKINSLNAYLSALDESRNRAYREADATWTQQTNEKNKEKDEQTLAYNSKMGDFEQELGEAFGENASNTADALANLDSSLSTLGMGGGEELQRKIVAEANRQNRNANAEYARNKQKQTQEYNTYMAGYNDDIQKINDQRNYSRGKADENWASNRKNTLNAIADTYNDAGQNAQRQNYINQADSLNSLIANAAFVNPSYTGVKRKMATPELADLTANVPTFSVDVADASNGQATGLGSGSALPSVKSVALNKRDLGLKRKQEGDTVYGV